MTSSLHQRNRCGPTAMDCRCMWRHNRPSAITDHVNTSWAGDVVRDAAEPVRRAGDGDDVTSPVWRHRRALDSRSDPVTNMSVVRSEAMWSGSIDRVPKNHSNKASEKDWSLGSVGKWSQLLKWIWNWPFKVKSYMFRTDSTRRTPWFHFHFCISISKTILMKTTSVKNDSFSFDALWSQNYWH